MWKSAIKEAFERAISLTAFKATLLWIKHNFYEYRFYIVVGLIIMGILVIFGLLIAWREKIKRKQL
jgi:hypothetical protein